MKYVFILTFIISIFGVISCSSNNNNSNGSVDTPIVASPEGMGADTTSAKTDSLRDSLNR